MTDGPPTPTPSPLDPASLNDRAEGFPIAVAPSVEPRSTPAAPATHAAHARAATHAAHPRLNTLAVLALVLGILLSPLAALFGHLAAGQITRSYGAERGLGIAWTAASLGWLWTLLLAIAIGGVWVALST